MTHPATTDHDRVRQLIADYCHLVDDGRIEEWLGLFVPDAVVTVAGHSFSGRTEIRGWIERIAASSDGPTRHLVTNSSIRLDGDGGTVTSDFVLVASTRRILAVGRYDDVVRRSDGSWHFAERRITMLPS